MNRKRSRPLDGDECCGEPLPPALAATASAHGPAATSPRTHSDAPQWPGCSQGTACAVDSGKVRADEMPIDWLEADAAAVLHGILRSGRNGGKCADAGVNGSATLGAAAAALVRADLVGWQPQYHQQQQQQEQRQEEQQQERRQEQSQGDHMQADDRDDEGEEEDDLAPTAWRPPPPLAGSGAAGSGSAGDGDEDGHSPGAGGALMAAVAAGAPAPPGWLTWAVDTRITKTAVNLGVKIPRAMLESWWPGSVFALPVRLSVRLVADGRPYGDVTPVNLRADRRWSMGRQLKSFLGARIVRYARLAADPSSLEVHISTGHDPLAAAAAAAAAAAGTASGAPRGWQAWGIGHGVSGGCAAGRDDDDEDDDATQDQAMQAEHGEESEQLALGAGAAVGAAAGPAAHALAQAHHAAHVMAAAAALLQDQGSGAPPQLLQQQQQEQQEQQQHEKQHAPPVAAAAADDIVREFSGTAPHFAHPQAQQLLQRPSNGADDGAGVESAAAIFLAAVNAANLAAAIDDARVAAAAGLGSGAAAAAAPHPPPAAGAPLASLAAAADVACRQPLAAIRGGGGNGSGNERRRGGGGARAAAAAAATAAAAAAEDGQAVAARLRALQLPSIAPPHVVDNVFAVSGVVAAAREAYQSVYQIALALGLPPRRRVAACAAAKAATRDAFGCAAFVNGDFWLLRAACGRGDVDEVRAWMEQHEGAAGAGSGGGDGSM